MAQINKPSEHFNTVLYTGNGSTQSITGVNFKPDFTWIKDRTTSNSHYSANSIMGANVSLPTNGTNTQITDNGYGYMTSFDSDGFSLTNGASGAHTVNFSGDNYASWNWLAGGTASSNTDGSITSSVSANTTSGFSIVSYTGTGSSGTVGTGLNAVPKVIIFKNRDAVRNWNVYHESLGTGKRIKLNDTSAEESSTTFIANTTPTSSVFSLSTSGDTNNSGDNIIAYCFAEKKGFSKFGSYTGNGSTDGTFVYTGFKPAWVMVKRTDTSDRHWIVLDNKRNTYNPMDKEVNPDRSDAEQTNIRFDAVSNGIKFRLGSNATNGSGGSYIYMCFAEQPLVGTNNIPATAR